MNLTNRIYRLLIIPFMVGSIAQISAAENKINENVALEPTQQVNQALPTDPLFDACLKSHDDQITEITMILSDLQAIVVNNGVTVPNKRTMIESLQVMTMCMESLKEKMHLYTQVEELPELTCIIGAITEHIQDTLNKGFKEFAEFDFEGSLKRNLSLLDSTATLEAKIKKNADSLIQLKKQSQSVGLAWYNKAYRTFDSYVVQPGNKYNFLAPAFPYIGLNTEIALSAAGLATLYAYKFSYLDHTPADLKLETQNILKNPNYGKENCAPEINTTDEFLHCGYTHPVIPITEGKNETWQVNFSAKPEELIKDSTATQLHKKFAYHVRQWLGYPVRSQYGGAIDLTYHLDHKIGAIGKIESVCFGTPSLLLWLAARTATPTLGVWQRFCAYADKNTKNWANKLKGGAHANRSVEATGSITPKSTLDDPTGLTQAKEFLNKLIPFFLDPEAAVRQNKVPDLGYIFTGDPGNGKTYIVECLAGSIRNAFKQAGKNPDDVKLFELDSSSILTSDLHDIMTRAKQLAPCIIFIDEFDLLRLQRSANAQKLAEFLVEVNACFKTDPSKPVVIITATNCPTHCDKALFRDGRLGTHIEFELPKKINRKEFLTKKLKNIALDINQFDIERLTLETDHLSYASIEKLINLATMDAKLERQLLKQSHIDHVHDYRIRSILFNNDSEQSQQELQLIASHMAGKVLATELFSDLMEEGIARATILPYLAKQTEELPWNTAEQKKEDKQAVIEYGKICTYNVYDRFNPTIHANRNALQFKAIIQCLLAGFIAEELLFNAPSAYTYNLQDETKAGLLSLHSVAPGDGIQKMSEEQKTVTINKAIQFKELCKKEVFARLTEYRPALEALRNALLEKKILTGAEIKQIIAQAMPTKVLTAQ